MSTHNAKIAKVDNIMPILGADKIQTAFVLGTQVIVAKDVSIGDIGIFFDGELQLSQEFLKENNLFRQPEFNKDKEKKGFFDQNGRVRTQKFLGVKSEGLFISLSSLEFSGVNVSTLKVGDCFTEINGVQICKKYISDKTMARIKQGGKKTSKKADAPMFAKHIDTENIKYNWANIPVGSLLTISSKTHGTSGRYSYLETIRELPKWKQFVNRFINIFSNKKLEYLCGTRNVILFEEDSEKDGFHGCEGYRFDWLNKLKPHLEENMIIYGEVVGYANNSNIMPRHNPAILKDKAFEKKYGKDPFVYKYGCPEGTNDFFIYRISYTSPSGGLLDFTWPQIKRWCEKSGFKHVPEIAQPFIYDGDLNKLQEMVEYLTERPDKLTEDYIDPSHVSEGVVIRCDHGSPVPDFYKSKSFAFRVMEGIAKETEEDPEDSA